MLLLKHIRGLKCSVEMRMVVQSEVSNDVQQACLAVASYFRVRPKVLRRDNLPRLLIISPQPRGELLITQLS